MPFPFECLSHLPVFFWPLRRVGINLLLLACSNGVHSIQMANLAPVRMRIPGNVPWKSSDCAIVFPPSTVTRRHRNQTDTLSKLHHFQDFSRNSPRVYINKDLEAGGSSCYDGENWKELLPETSNMRTEALHCRKSLDRSPPNYSHKLG